MIRIQFWERRPVNERIHSLETGEYIALMLHRFSWLLVAATVGIFWSKHDREDTAKQYRDPDWL